MALTRFSGDADVISQLSNQPNDNDGLSAAQLKAKFDQFGSTFKTYVNNVLIPELESAINAAAAGISSSGFSGALLYDNSIAAEKLISTSGIEAVTTPVIRDGAVTFNKLGTDAKNTINGKQDELTFDSTPTASSTNPVTSDGIKTALDTKQPEHITGSANIASSSWNSSNVATATIQGVTSSNTIIVTPAPSSFLDWSDCGIRCTAQSTNQITLTARSKPSSTVTVQVLIFN